MASKNTVYLTEEGLKDLKAELDNLINVRRPENIQSIKEARSLGDLSENADYDAAKNEQAQIEGRIKTIEKMLENVTVINDIPKDIVGLGSTVAIKYIDDDDEDEYKIVGSQEADPFESKISNESPIAKALLNHKVGDVVTVESPNGNLVVSCGGFMRVKKNKKKKEKHIVGTKELIFDIVSVVLIICLGVYFGYRSILYYTKETNKKKVEANTLASAIINNNKITTEDNGFRKSEDGYYFSGLVENNYVKVFNRLYRVIEVTNANEVKIIANGNHGVMIYGDSKKYQESNINLWLNKSSVENSGIYENSIPGVEKLLKKFSYCEGTLKNDKVSCKNKKGNSYFSILEIEDYIRARGKKSFLNNGSYSYLLGSDTDGNPLVVAADGTASGVSNYEGYGIRPVMMLKKNILITGGDGSIGNPYVINQEGNDNYINKYVKMGNDLYQVIEVNNNNLSLRLNDYLKVKNVDVELVFNTKGTQFELLNRSNIGYYLNRTYYNSLTYKNYLGQCSFYTGEISLVGDGGYSYTNVYKDSVVAKVGMLNMVDFNDNTTLDTYYLINSTSNVGNLVYTYNKLGLIDEVKVSAKKKIVPVVCLDKTFIKAGDGSINNPYVVE